MMPATSHDTLTTAVCTGNRLAAKGRGLVQNAEEWNKTYTDPETGFGGNVELLWIVDNAPNAIFPGFLKTIDGYVQVVIDSVRSVNKIQLILLGLEGCGVCALCSAWIWHVSVGREGSGGEAGEWREGGVCLVGGQCGRVGWRAGVATL